MACKREAEEEAGEGMFAYFTQGGMLAASKAFGK